MVAGKDIITMSVRELKRLHIIRKVVEKKLKQVDAARLLGITDRQARRVVTRYRKEGEQGIVHRARGRASNRTIAPKIRARALRLYRKQYDDFGPTFGSEKLEERHGLRISAETLRLWLIEEGVPYRRHRSRPHRRWRERKRYCGEMVQMDGSHHDWLEGRGPRLVLMGYVDDATGKVYGRFYMKEGTGPALDSFRRYIDRYGIPQSVYLDRHAAYKAKGAPTIEDELSGRRPQSQFERALEELGVRVIHATSPQAKGRVERIFRTLQNRLVKEMRLRGIKSLREANAFLEKYLPEYNRRFTVEAAEEADMHRPLPAGMDLSSVLCVKTVRTVKNDFTISYKNRLYQISRPHRMRKVIVEEHLDGRLRLTCRGKDVRFTEIKPRLREVPTNATTRRKGKPQKPPLPHPWRKYSYRTMPAAAVSK